MKLKYFSLFEISLWSFSVATIIISFLLFKGDSELVLTASLIGVTSLIFNAKGNPIGQVLMIIFSILYGIISFDFKYFGEMITYLGMTAPMAFLALVSWLKNPYNGKKSEVAVAAVNKKDIINMILSSVLITLCFYFILLYFNTTNLIPSTISVTTSFLAAYLTYKRSPYFALAYAANDCVLICLWILASLSDSSYISVIICFAMFLLGDLYGFINWRRMKKKQEEN